MAEMLVLKVVIDKLVVIATEQVELLGSVKGQVNKLVGDLEAMKAFLADAQASCYRHPNGEAQQVFIVWVKQVREVSYETEDAIEEFIARISSDHWYSHVLRLKTRHDLATKIKQIRSTISSICERRNAFGLGISGGCSPEVGMLTSDLTDPRSASLFIDDTDIIGIDAPKKELIEKIRNEDSRLAATFVTGMGGLGKTTLVKKAFDNIVENFKFHGWVTVSKPLNELQLLRDTFKEFKDSVGECLEPNNLQQMSKVELVEAIRSLLLGQRFLIVLDDVWSANAWEALKYALPDTNSGSRILITTRNDEIATHFDMPVFFQHLQPLPDKEAWTLFCMKAFRGDEFKGVCPKVLESLSVSILNKCEGLPLAIVAMCGILSRKNKTMLEWKTVYDTLSAELRRHGNLEGLSKILMLSYDDLPYHLKTCYLYFSVFPEDFLIYKYKIVQLWVAERFVEEKEGLTLEKVAEGYLNEFVSRNLVEVVQVDLFNDVLSFRVHDIMREIIQSKSKEEALVELMDDKQHLTNITKARRVAIHHSFDGLLKISKTLPHIWSLLLYANLSADLLLNEKFFKGFRRLRVVDLANSGLRKFPEQLVHLIHLRCLSLRDTMIRTLPESIRKLKNLDVLHVMNTPIASLPDGILQLKQLRQLYNFRPFEPSLRPICCEMICPTCIDWRGMTFPAGIGCLTKLEWLGNINVAGDRGRALIHEIGKLVKLRVLGLSRLEGDSGPDVCASVARLSELRTLNISSQTQGLVVDLSSLSSPPQYLEDVLLRCGIITLPNWISSLNYLTKLRLRYSNLEQDPLAALQNLPSLVYLQLVEAYNGKELCCAGPGYTKLMCLDIIDLPNLESIKLLDGTMPELRKMSIRRCKEMKMMPQGIENLKKLECFSIQEIPVLDYPRELDGSTEEVSAR